MDGMRTGMSITLQFKILKSSPDQKLFRETPLWSSPTKQNLLRESNTCLDAATAAHSQNLRTFTSLIERLLVKAAFRINRHSGQELTEDWKQV